MNEKKQKAIDNLLDCVEAVCEGWSWFPEDQFGADEAISHSGDLLNLAAAYQTYIGLEEAKSDEKS